MLAKPGALPDLLTVQDQPNTSDMVENQVRSMMQLHVWLACTGQQQQKQGPRGDKGQV